MNPEPNMACLPHQIRGIKDEGSLLLIHGSEIPQTTTWDVQNAGKEWEKLPINWCRMSSVNSINCIGMGNPDF